MSSLADVFRTLNDLHEAGLFAEYAVGGGMAVLFYAEPVRTYDVDVFIFLPPQSGFLIDMTPLYRALSERGFFPDAEHILVHGVAVQFLPAYNPLVEEAVANARICDYEGVSVRVIGPEYLIALALQTGGSKRRLRAETMIEQGAADEEKLQAILQAHGILGDRNAEGQYNG